jgi:hypothetical protein
LGGAAALNIVFSYIKTLVSMNERFQFLLGTKEEMEQRIGDEGAVS